MSILTEINSQSLNSKPDYFSISRLDTYTKCGVFYKNRYVDRLTTPMSYSSTLGGSVAHHLLYESYLGGREESIPSIFKRLISQILMDNGIILEELSEEEVELIVKYSMRVAGLIRKAMPGYEEDDAIRTKTGAYSKDYLSTTAWQKAYGEKGLGMLEDEITKVLLIKNVDLELTDRPGLKIATGYYYACVYTPPENEEVIGLELPISLWSEDRGEIINPIKWPGFEEYIHGYIDKVSRVDGVLTITDYKTDAAIPTPEYVFNHRQSLLYAHVISNLMGEQVEQICIDNIRHKERVVVKVTPERIEDNLNTLLQAVKGIKSELYLKQPFSSYSSCTNWFGRNNCPYKDLCYPY